MQIMSLGYHCMLHLNNISEMNSIVAEVVIRFHKALKMVDRKQSDLYDLSDDSGTR